MPTALHIEGPIAIGHPICQFLRPYLTFHCAPWLTNDIPELIDRAQRTPAAQRAWHFGWAEHPITDPHLEDAWKDPARPEYLNPARQFGPDADTTADAIADGFYPVSNLVKLLEPLARALHKARMTSPGWVYIDAEFFWSPYAKDPITGAELFPGVAAKLAGRIPPSIDEQSRVSRLALFKAFRRAFAAVDLDPDSVCQAFCADRTLKPWQPWAPVPALGIPIRRSMLTYTDPAPELNDRMEAEMMAGSGPRDILVLLQSSVDPAINAQRLAKARRTNAGHLTLYADWSVEGVANPTYEQLKAATWARLDAQMPVFANAV